MVDFHLSNRLLIERVPLGIQVGESGVEVDLGVFFPRAPLAALSDDPKDTVSFAQCVEIVQREASKKTYQTIEHLAQSLHMALKKVVPIGCEVMVKVKRLQGAPPGVSFTYFPKPSVEEQPCSSLWEEV